MTKQEKLLNKFISRPTKFLYNELIRLLRGLGYKELQGSGSRIVFQNKEIKHSIKLRKPQPDKVLKRYQIDLIIQELKSKNLL